MSARAWVLNFDAERELEAVAGRSTPTAAVRARAADLEGQLGGLVEDGDVVLRDGDALAEPGRFEGAAWCPTPGALARMAHAGVQVPPAPALSVLRRANHRAFSAELGQELPGAAFVRTLDAVTEVVVGPSPFGEWLLKRPFGFAGRGRRKVHAGPLSAHDRAWVQASLDTGEGLQVEPWIVRTDDFGLHGLIAGDGAFRLGAVTRQQCDDMGAWRGTALAGAEDLDQKEREALVASARGAARALAVVGYFGPFGVDAYRWSDAQGGLHFNARSEINARYSMGWAVGMRPADGER